MPSITITVSADGAKWRADNLSGSRLVNGNSDYTLRLSFIGDGWSGTSTAEITAVAEDGEAETLTRTGTNIALPAMHDKTMLRVNVARGDRQTTTPAIIFCDVCATDNAGTTDTPKPDIYNLMMEMIHQKEIGAEEAASAILAQLTALRENAPPAFPGDAYRLATARSDRVTRITGTITQKDGTTQEITDDDILADSLSIGADIMNNEFLIPGGCPSAELRVGFRERVVPDSTEGAEIELTYHIQRHDEIWCDIPLGTFTAASDEKTEQGVQIVAYDDMKKLGDIPLSRILYRRGGTNTSTEIVNLILLESGIEWDGVWPEYAGTFKNVSWNIDKAGSAVETAWDLLTYLLQAHGLVAYIDRFRILRIKKLNKNAAVAQYATAELVRNKVSKIPYKQASLSTAYTYTDDHTGGTAVGRYLFDTFYEDGVTVYMSENPLWNGVIDWDRIPEKRSVAGIYLALVAEAISQCVYKPGEITIHGDPAIDLTDWITVETTNGNAEYPITNTHWQYHGEHTLVAVGTEAITGIGRTQAEKKALSKEELSASSWQFLSKNTTLQVIHASGHRGMSGYTHAWLHLFRHEQFEEIIAQEGTT